MEKEMKIVRIFVHHRIVSAVKGVELLEIGYHI
jgi:hypothetical protein